MNHLGGDAARWLHGHRLAFPCFLPVWGCCLGLRVVVVFNQEHLDMHHLEQSFSGWKVLFTTCHRKSQWGELLDGYLMGEGRIKEQHKVQMI